MKYAVLLYDDENRFATMTPAEGEELMAQHGRYSERVVELGGSVLEGQALQSTTTARSVRWTDDASSMTVTDGPFAETTEQFGGYYVVDMPDLDAAIEAAKALPHDVELRPVVVHDMPGDEQQPTDVDGDLFLVLLYGEEETWLRATPEEREEMYAQHGRFGELIGERGAQFVAGEELAHTSTATTVRRGSSDIVISDGPFAETTEQLTGYYLIRAKGMDVVVDLLQALPGGTNEIRPVEAMEGAAT